MRPIVTPARPRACARPALRRRAPRAALLACLLIPSISPAASPEPARGSDDAPAGRWSIIRDSSRRDAPAGAEDLEALRSLGYLSGSQVAVASGVTHHETDRTWAGWNLYCSGHGPAAILMDMDGEVLHRWERPFHDAFPERQTAPDAQPTEFWRRVHLFPNGDLLAIFDGQGLVKIDSASRLLWARGNGAHHELAVRPNGDIWVLARTAARMERDGRSRSILEDQLLVLDADGTERRRISILDAFRDTEWEALPATGPKWDVLHTNTLHPLEGRIADRIPAFRAGDVLLSMRNIHTIAVLAMDTGRITWAHRGDFHLQHDPRVLDNGNLLLFDNGPRERAASTVYEIDPVTGGTVWSYRGTDESPFFSKSCGTAQRFPNGNTLVVESDAGRAFELDPDGDIVWEFYNPHVGGDEGQYIATLFEVVRLPYDFPTDWAEPPGEGE